jgi:hypothetical protein
MVAGINKSETATSYSRPSERRHRAITARRRFSAKFFSRCGVDFACWFGPADHANTLSPEIVAEATGGIEVFTAMRATGQFFRRTPFPSLQNAEAVILGFVPPD